MSIYNILGIFLILRSKLWRSIQYQDTTRGPSHSCTLLAVSEGRRGSCRAGASPRAEGMSALTYSLFGTLHSRCEAPQSTLVGSSVLQTESGRAHYWRIQQFGSNWVNSITKGERKIFKNVDLLRISPVKFVYISSRFVVRSPIFMLAHYLWSDRRTNLIYLQIFSFLPVSEHVPPRWSALSPAPRP